MNIDSPKVWNDNVNHDNDSKYKKLSSSTKRLSLLRNVLPRNLIATPTTIIVNHMVPKNNAAACGCFRGLDIRSSCRSSVNSAITLDDEIKKMPHRRVSCIAIGETQKLPQLLLPARQPHRRSTLTMSSRGIGNDVPLNFYPSTPEREREDHTVMKQTLQRLLRPITQNPSSSPPRQPQRRSTTSFTSRGMTNLSLPLFTTSSSPQRQRRQEQQDDSPVLKQTLRVLKTLSNQQEQSKQPQQQSPPRQPQRRSTVSTLSTSTSHRSPTGPRRRQDYDPSMLLQRTMLFIGRFASPVTSTQSQKPPCPPQRRSTATSTIGSNSNRLSSWGNFPLSTTEEEEEPEESSTSTTKQTIQNLSRISGVLCFDDDHGGLHM